MRRGTGKRSDSSSRRTLFDYLDEAEQESNENKFCNRGVLKSEAGVEQFFVLPMLRELGYEDDEIRLKESLAEIVVARGRKKENYKPDYVLNCADAPRWLIDAKAPDEDLDDWVYQGRGYALGLNSEIAGANPCRYFVLTNGIALQVYAWDEKEPVLALEFGDFVDDNPSFLNLKSLLSARAARRGWIVKTPTKLDTLTLKKPNIEEIKRVFNQCHQLIWKTEKMNPQPAFFEFVKIMFVKLFEDRQLHNDPNIGPALREGKPLAKDQVVFSNYWINKLISSGVENPIDSILFEKLARNIREGVSRGKKKPIFEDTERIKLQTGTIKQVVAKLEQYDMFGIDEDLNGRLFETFLSATMRGQALGQYFTPRSITKLMTRLARPSATREYVDTVLDACCGTGGFLIEALTDMRKEITSNSTLTAEETDALLDTVANESIFGIDAGRQPPIARIARINMYLHGDGGSRIYAADSLDKSAATGVGDDEQSRRELEEIQKLVREIAANKRKGTNDGFDIVLTNPPFSMGYSDAIESEDEILRQYDIAKIGMEGTAKRRPSLTSNIMFIERYADLLKWGGKLITVIDDSVLSSPKYAFARRFIRQHFIVRAVISLPGDAFQRVGARAKTSALFLINRTPGETGQPDVFMAECQYVGLDDVPVKTRPSVAREARKLAEEEMAEVVKAYGEFLSGKRGPWLVSGDRIQDRLDVKFCLPRIESVEDDWLKAGLEVLTLEDIVEEITDTGFNPRLNAGEVYTLLRVRYDGIAEDGEKALGVELTYSNVQHPRVGDLVASNIAAHLGSICVCTERVQHTIASNEFTIMRLKDSRFDAWFLWGYLRSVEVRARLLSTSSGTNRQRIGWDDLRSLPVPVVDSAVQAEIGKRLRESVEAIATAESVRRAASAQITEMLDLENEWAVHRLKAAKPPK